MISDYNGFNAADWNYGLGENGTNVALNPYSQVQYGIDGRNADGSYSENASTSADPEKDAWDQYFVESGLGKTYSKGIGDFMENGTFDEWYDAVNSPLLKDFYQGQIDQFGDLNNKDNFQNYWDYYKANAIDKALTDVNLVGDYIGSSGGLTNDIARYMIESGLMDEKLQEYFGYDPTIATTGMDQNTYDQLYNITKYQLGDNLLQNYLSRGITGDAFLNALNPEEINDIFVIDPNEYTLDATDSEGPLNTWGKNKNATHDTGFDAWQYENNPYGAAGTIPYAGLADTLTALAGDKLYHKERQPQQQQQEGSE